jgi:hypothetical protein
MAVFATCWLPVFGWYLAWAWFWLGLGSGLGLVLAHAGWLLDYLWLLWILLYMILAWPCSCYYITYPAFSILATNHNNLTLTMKLLVGLACLPWLCLVADHLCWLLYKYTL